MTLPFLSIIIPAYNEEARIAASLTKVVNYLHTQPYTWQVIVADDGSTDGTIDLVQTVVAQEPMVSLLKLPHLGKGWAVKHGMLSAKGEYCFQCDADLSMPIEQLSRFLPPHLEEYDIAVGSRDVAGARRIGEPWARHLMGRVFNKLVRILAIPRVRDTQCGFKCYRGKEVIRLFSYQRLHQFAFDVEILMLASHRGLRVKEVPIDWYYRPRSKVHPLKDPLLMVKDLLRIRWHLFRGTYREVDKAFVSAPIEERERGGP